MNVKFGFCVYLRTAFISFASIMNKKVFRICINILTFLFFVPQLIDAQEAEVRRLMEGELKMTFPSIYFKPNSMEYAAMPYSADSCYKYISDHFSENINSLIVWRDSLETEDLSVKRIKKIKKELRKYVRSGKIEIESMEAEQKLPRRIIEMTADSTQIKYLLSFNTGLDFSRTKFAAKKTRTYKNHYERPRLNCWDCWISGFHYKERRRIRKAKKEKEAKAAKISFENRGYIQPFFVLLGSSSPRI